MTRRCYNKRSKDYPRYGGRGITVCDLWRYDFVTFISDMGHRPSKRHTLDRINNNGNYEPGNCRWATAKQQSQNRRSSNFHRIGGQEKCLTEWCEIYGIHPATVISRLKRGLGLLDALTRATPTRH